jgi:hypothetical protein
MKQLLFIILSLVIVTKLQAQQPVFDKTKITPQKQKQVDPGPVQPYIAPVTKVGFSAKISRDRFLLTGDRFNNFDQVLFNDANGFDAPSGVFTTPTAGYYFFMFTITLLNYARTGSPLTFRVGVNKNSSPHETFDLPVYDREGYATQSFTMFIQLAKGDKISLGAVNAVSIEGGSNPAFKTAIFSGYRVQQ